MRIFVVLAVLFIATATADKLFCPPRSVGEHPNCVCEDKDFPYDVVNNVCSIEINVNQICPKGMEGHFPNCICKDGKVFVPKTSECVAVDRSQCPHGSKKVDNKCVCEHRNGFKYEFDEIFFICRPWYIPTTTQKPRPCPPHQHLVGDKCEWDLCPSGYTSETGYWPGCRGPPSCRDKGMIGEYPNCHGVVIHQCNYHQHLVGDVCEWDPCPQAYISKTGYWPDCRAPPSCSERGLIGVYPDCRPPPPTCPPHHHRTSDGQCVRIPCPPEQEGDYQPNCKLVPKCPPEYPGKWPYCNIYATTPHNTYIPPETPTTPKPTTRQTTAPTTTRPTTRVTTTKATTTRAPSTTTTPRPTPTPKCRCECNSNEIVVFKDLFEWNPALKYKRSANKN